MAKLIIDDKEIERMVKDAEMHASEDAKRREAVDTKNHADQLAYSIERAIEDAGDKIDAGDKSQVESAIAEVRKAVETDDASQIKAAHEKLSKIWQGVATKLHQAGAQAGGPGEGPDPGAASQGSDGSQTADGPVDAEYEVVDEDKSK